MVCPVFVLFGFMMVVVSVLSMFLRLCMIRRGSCFALRLFVFCVADSVSVSGVGVVDVVLFWLCYVVCVVVCGGGGGGGLSLR